MVFFGHETYWGEPYTTLLLKKIFEVVQGQGHGLPLLFALAYIYRFILQVEHGLGKVELCGIRSEVHNMQK